MNLDQEETTTLTDVLHRVRNALLPDSELNLFAKRPEYAEKSDRLAVAMRRGDARTDMREVHPLIVRRQHNLTRQIVRRGTIPCLLQSAILARNFYYVRSLVLGHN